MARTYYGRPNALVAARGRLLAALLVVALVLCHRALWAILGLFSVGLLLHALRMRLFAERFRRWSDKTDDERRARGYHLCHDPSWSRGVRVSLTRLMRPWSYILNGHA